MTLKELKQALLDRSEQVAQYLIPNGKIKGNNYTAGDIQGNIGSSFSINLKTGEFNDFADPDVHGGNLLELWAQANGLKFADAITDAKRWLGVEDGKPIQKPKIIPQFVVKKSEKKLTIPKLIDDVNIKVKFFDQTRKTRGLPLFAGLQIAEEKGCFGFFYGIDGTTPYWLVKDRLNRVAQARRCDGDLILIGDKYRKSKTLAGANAKIPVGWIPHKARGIFFVEGSPDFLAVITQAWIETDCQINDIGFMAMLGSHSIEQSEIEQFRGHKVCIFRHNDEAGTKASNKWKEQLESVGCRVTVLQYPVEGYDLNDAMRDLIKKSNNDDFDEVYEELLKLNIMKGLK